MKQENEDEREHREMEEASKAVFEFANKMFDEVTNRPDLLEKIPLHGKIEIVAGRVACELADRAIAFGLMPIDMVPVAARVVAICDEAFKNGLLDKMEQKGINETVEKMFRKEFRNKEDEP